MIEAAAVIAGCTLTNREKSVQYSEKTY